MDKAFRESFSDKLLVKGQLETFKFRLKNKLYYKTQELKIRFSEVDQYKVLWNGHYVQYFELARLELCQYFNFSLGSLSQISCALPVHSYNLEIKIPITLNDSFFVYVRPESFENSMLVFKHLLVSKHKVHALGTFKHILLNTQENTIMNELTPNVAHLISPMLEKFQKEIDEKPIYSL